MLMDSGQARAIISSAVHRAKQHFCQAAKYTGPVPSKPGHATRYAA